MGLPKVEITDCTREDLEGAYQHEKFGRVIRFRGKDLDDMDLNDFREMAQWVCGVMSGAIPFEYKEPEPEPVAEAPADDGKGKKTGQKDKKAA